ncbi:putative sulfoacetate transporter SauU [Burkholderiales bacterium]|nr:putative sulfoacetate transporter SauU [Burkholderiales bacterium]
MTMIVPFSRIYAAFAAGYLMSYLFRTVNAVISPELTREIGLGPGALGLLTSVYFVAFAAMQIPAGLLLDRYGPRRVEPVLLVIAATGTFAFAAADSLAGLTVARALIGAGVSVCLMAPLKGIAVWYPPHRQASLAGWVMVAGGAGALVATTPVELALRHVEWRTLFVAFGAVTLAVAAAIAWRVPDLPRAANPPSLAEQWAGVRRVFTEPRFWWIVPVGAIGMGSFMAIQGLWSVPWMMEVEGLTRAEAAQVLLAMGVLTLAGYLGLGLFATRLARFGFGARHMYLAGWTINLVALLAIVLRAPGAPIWWCAYGFGAAANILAFTVLNEGFPPALAGRTNTAANLTMFAGSFVAQWGIGVVADAARATAGVSVAGGLRFAFVLVLALVAASFAWFLVGWKRHAAPPARAGA